MYCSMHKVCTKSGDNGHCTVTQGMPKMVNRTFQCGYIFIPEKKVDAKTRVGQQKQKK